MRIGIGPIPPQINQIDFVLMKYDKSALSEVNEICERSARAALKIIDDGLEKAMNEVTKK